MKYLACFCVLFFASFANAQESIADRLSRLESSTGAMLSRLRSDVTDLRADVKALGEKIDAVAKVAAPGAKFTASTVNEWGDGATASFSGQQQSAYSMMNYSSVGSACAGGSCGVSRPMLFRRGRR